MGTAAERAAEVIDATDDEFVTSRGFNAAGAELVAALMADPDLLVDLAIEAGGLELADRPYSTYNPLYRRASRPTGEDRP